MSELQVGKKSWSGGIQIIVGAIVLIIASGLAMPGAALPIQLLLSILAIAIVWFGFKMIFQRGEKDIYLSDIDFFTLSRKSMSKMGLGLLIGVVLFSLSVIILTLSKQYEISFNGFNGWALIEGALLFITVGCYEELFTRGIIQHLLGRRFNKWIALWGTSLIFSSMHFFNDSFTIISFLGIVAAGVALGMSMYATNSITVAIGFHISWNWIQGYFYGISVSGTGLGENVSILNTSIIGHSELLTGGGFGAEASIVTVIILFLFSFLCYLYGRKQTEVETKAFNSEN